MVEPNHALLTFYSPTPRRQILYAAQFPHTLRCYGIFHLALYSVFFVQSQHRDTPLLPKEVRTEFVSAQLYKLFPGQTPQLFYEVTASFWDAPLVLWPSNYYLSGSSIIFPLGLDCIACPHNV